MSMEWFVAVLQVFAWPIAIVLIIVFMLAGGFSLAGSVYSSVQSAVNPPEPTPTPVPEGHVIAPEYPFLITAVTNATQTTTLIWITWSINGGYQVSGMFTRNTLPAGLSTLPVYKMSDIEPGPLKIRLNYLLEDIIWTP